MAEDAGQGTNPRRENKLIATGVIGGMTRAQHRLRILARQAEGQDRSLLEPGFLADGGTGQRWKPGSIGGRGPEPVVPLAVEMSFTCRRGQMSGPGRKRGRRGR